jgi:predicted Zn finger-like uncharacterized protein
MIVECHSCGATYNISDEKIRGRRVRVRCKSCNEGIIVDGTRVDSDEATRVYSPNFEPGLYAARVHDEATRVMAPSGPDLRATASNDEWTVNIGESDQRTMDLAELISSYTGGLIPDDALVWREGMDDWLPIREMPELKAAIDSNEATHVVSPAMAVRAPRRAAGDRAMAHQMEPSAEPPPRAMMASLSEFSEPVAPVAPRARAAPVAADAPVPAPAPVARAERAPSARPAAVERPIAAARVRESRAAGGDLFGNIEAAGAEEALLGSSALSQYDEKPIGARNESSVLFSLDALKAGARRGSSAPPRMPSNPPQTAADILGMTAGGALPGMSASGSLLSAPAVEAPPVSPYAPTTPPRSKMDTLPPMMRPRRGLPLPAIAVAAAIIVGGIAFFMVRARLSHPGVVEAPAVQSTAAAHATAAEEPTTVVAKAAEPEPPPATAAPAAPETPPPPETTAAPPPQAPMARPASAGRAPQGDGVTAPAIPSKPQTASSPTSLEAALKAMRPDKGESAAKPAAEKGAGTEKVVLAEEPSGAGAESTDKAEEPPKPPFDTAAAKAALETASSSAASCKKDDGPTGRGKVQVTFSPNGRATSANVIDGPFGGTPVGGCIAKIFRGAKVPPFSGDPVTVAKSFTIPD